ncbi:MAG TPA: hypothetical protein DHM44_09160, partial [Flexistipes sinusarabici]|nr:hypothetical protein [Flexistipes sinusarabici]
SQFSTLTAFKDDPWPDFQLKILGIDPHVIPDELKKTRYAVKNISDFNRGLNKISENKSTIFIQAKTSTFLRTMPEESLSALLGKLSAMGFTLISDDEYVIDNANKNYINLVKIICHSFDELMGVVMSVDAVITCDTFMLHFSNAANKKTIGIFNCMSSESYTYLPYQANLIRINVDKEYIFSNKVVMSEDEVKDMGKEKYFYEMWQNSVNEVINNLEL